MKDTTIKRWERRQRLREKNWKNSTSKIHTELNMNQIQGCWRRLKLQSKKEYILQRREARREKLVEEISLSSPVEVSKLIADVKGTKDPLIAG